MDNTNKNDIKYKDYNIIINARNFHYENFNKWMTYYYVAVAAVFVGFYNIDDCNQALKLFLLVVGYIISVLWHLSCKGYYFWVKHWTTQLLKFEESNNFSIYSTFNKSVKENENKLWNPLQSANVSTSKVTLLFSFCITIAWLFFILHKYINCGNCFINIMLNIIASLFMTLMVTFVLKVFLKSDLTNHKIV